MHTAYGWRFVIPLMFLFQGASYGAIRAVQDEVVVEAEVGQPEVTGTFRLVNDGVSAVNIVKLQSSCGCAKADATKMLVRPGEESTISVRVKLDGSSSFLNKSVIVTTDDKATPIIILKVAVLTSALLKPSVPELKWESSDDVRTIELVAKCSGSIEIVEVRADPKQRFEIQDVVAGRKFRLIVHRSIYSDVRRVPIVVVARLKGSSNAAMVTVINQKDN